MFSRNERRNWWVTYISGGKSCPTLIHKFTNHARLSLKFTFHISFFSLIHASRVNPFTRMQTRRNWSINRCSTGETFLIALSKSVLRLPKFEPRWYTWGLKKKNEKGMLRSDICEKEDNHKFFKNSSETRTFVSVTFSKLPF